MPVDSPLHAALEAVLPGFGEADLSAALATLESYVRLLHKWAPKVNLVSLEDLPEVVARHVLPALALVPAVRAVPHERVLDVGSGAGFPGLPLAIALPGSRFTLVESRRRRANFLRQAVRELGLTHVRAVCARVEDWAPPEPVDLVVSRAVTDQRTLARLAGHCLAPHGLLLTTTGPDTRDRRDGQRAQVLLQLQRPARVEAHLAHPRA